MTPVEMSLIVSNALFALALAISFIDGVRAHRTIDRLKADLERQHAWLLRLSGKPRHFLSSNDIGKAKGPGDVISIRKGAS